MGPAPPGVRNLFRSGLLLFVITVVIGILNGLDVWDPPRNTLLTHVHAGTLGWITLTVFGGAIWMFGDADDDSSRPLANFTILAISLYVLAFWSVDLTDTISIQRPIGGTLAFVAMAWMFAWASKRKRQTTWSVADLGMVLALGFMVIGAVLGVLLGLQLADIEIVDPSRADQLYESHPGAMVAGFVILAGLALIEQLMPGRPVPTLSESKSGVTQMMLLFTAGILFVAGSLLAVDPLLQAAGGLQLVGVLILIVRFGKHLAPRRWTGSPENQFVRIAVVGMVISVGLIVYLIGELTAGAEFADIFPIAIAFDHINFIMVITNLIFAMMVMTLVVGNTAARLIFAGVNVGVAGFAIGLIAESPGVKRVFTPILGLALLYGIWIFFSAPEREVPPRPELSKTPTTRA